MFMGRCRTNSLVNIARHIHTCTMVCNKATNKQAKMLTKLMTGSHRKKKNWVNVEFMAKAPILPSDKSFRQGSRTHRRTDVLNKLIMRSITDLFATGDVGRSIVGRGLSITKVKVSPDFRTVNCYWIAKGTTVDAEFMETLNNCAFELRHELCQLHILGIMPRICFVADKQQYLFEDIEQCLKQVKYTETFDDDYLSSESEDALKSQYALEMPMDTEVLAKIEELDENLEENPLPPMTHDVLGLNHAAIMSRIQASLKLSEARHRYQLHSSDEEVHSEPESVSEESNYHHIGPSEIATFINKQKIMKRRAMQIYKRQLLDMDLNDESTNEDNYVDVDDGDFIEYEDLKELERK